MKLHYHPISTYSQKVLIALYEKGLEFESEIVQLMDPDANAAYRETYPLGKIPCLALENGHLIPESSIIIEYIDDMAGPALIAGDATATRQIRFKDRMLALSLTATVTALLFQGIKPEAERDQEKIDRANSQIDTIYDFMEKELDRQPFAAGNEFSMADCAAAPALFYARQVAPFEARDNISAYWDRLSERDSVKKTQEEAAPAIAAFMAQSAA